jgi:hypothetical protein
MKPSVNKVWFDRRASQKPRWFCSVSGGVGPNNTSVSGKGVGCCRWIAWRRAKRNWKNELKRGM